MLPLITIGLKILFSAITKAPAADPELHRERRVRDLVRRFQTARRRSARPGKQPIAEDRVRRLERSLTELGVDVSKL